MAAPKTIGIPVVAVCLLAGAGAWYALRWPGNGHETLRLSGNIETVEVAISFKIPGRVEKRFVDEGDPVYEGKPVARLETADLKADVALRRAELGAAEAVLAEAEHGSRPDEIKASQAFMEKARATLNELEAGSRPQEKEAAAAEWRAAAAERDRAKRDQDRADQLQRTNPGAITPEQLDQARTAYRVAEDRYVQAMKRYDLVKEGPRKEVIEQARHALLQAEASFRLVQEGPRQEAKQQLRAKVDQAKAALQAAETKLGYATVVSPLTGVVLSKNTEEGEYVAPGTPIVTVADLRHVWLRAYVDERDLGKRALRLGSEATVTTDAYPDKKYVGRISFISSEQEFTPKTVQTNRERVKFVYRIKIDIDNADKELKPGMPADATIALKPNE